MDIAVEKVATNLYRLSSREQVLMASAQDLRTVYEWCLMHMRELEQESEQESRSHQKEVIS